MTRRPPDPAFEERVRASFHRQLFVQSLGAVLTRVEPGEVSIDLPFRPDLTQQHGFLHAGAIASVVDSACGYAALSLMAPGDAVLSVEFKLNLLAPGRGQRFRATGSVVRAGRTITVCAGEMLAVDGESESLVAVMQATMMSVRARAGLAD